LRFRFLFAFLLYPADGGSPGFKRESASFGFRFYRLFHRAFGRFHFKESGFQGQPLAEIDALSVFFFFPFLSFFQEFLFEFLGEADPGRFFRRLFVLSGRFLLRKLAQEKGRSESFGVFRDRFGHFVHFLSG
jgi:hypothetical protein